MTSTTSTSTTSTSIVPSPPSVPRKKGFRLQGKNLFLTFPQCPAKKEEVQVRLLGKWQEELDWYIIAEEDHADGTPHLHLLLSFKEQFRTCRLDAFDFLGGKHGNYQVAKNQKKCVQYVTKSDNYLAVGIDVASVLQKKSGKFGTLAKLIMEGNTLQQLNDVDPGSVLMHKRKLEEYIAWNGRRKEKEAKLVWKPFLAADVVDLDSTAEIQIAEWLNQNIKRPKEFKSKQLYIWGPPNMGKSSLIRKLSEYLNVYHIPRDEDFYDEYEDEIYDLAVLDEFTHTKTMQWLNQWLDGQTFYLRKKGGQIRKSQNIPTIILSNFDVIHNFNKLYEANKLGPLLERLLIVKVESFISIFQ